MSRSARQPLRVAFWPRDSNPYQGRLGTALAELGVEVSYLGEVTRSHTGNVLLLPIELIRAKRRGFSVIHLHWLYRFKLPVPGGSTWLVRRLCRVWLALVLLTLRLARLRLVWTVHNVLPHAQVFDDDSKARARLLNNCDAIVVHSAETLAELAQRGWPQPALIATIPPAALTESPTITRSAARAELGLPPHGCVIGLLGRIDRYKRPLELIAAADAQQPAASEPAPEVELAIVIAGRCQDSDLAAELRKAADRAQVPICLVLRELTDTEFDTYLAALDAFVVPFQKATTSGSVATALAAGRRVLVPATVRLGDIPPELITYYSDLGAALTGVAAESPVSAAAHRERAISWADSRSWAEVAAETAELYRQSLRVGRRRRRIR